MKNPQRTNNNAKTVKEPKDKPAGEMHTDYPLSEKDEVKKAEKKTQKGLKK